MNEIRRFTRTQALKVIRKALNERSTQNDNDFYDEGWLEELKRDLHSAVVKAESDARITISRDEVNNYAQGQGEDRTTLDPLTGKPWQ